MPHTLTTREPRPRGSDTLPDAAVQGILRTAQQYVASGFSIVPVKADGTKAPDAAVLPNGKWTPFQEHLPSPSDLTRWFGGNGSGRGIALVHGRVSGNSLVLDFETLPAYDAWLGLCDDHGFGTLARSAPTIATPAGGRHVLVRGEEPVQGNQKLAYRLLAIPDDADRTNNGRNVVVEGKEYPLVTVAGKEWGKVIVIETHGQNGYSLAPGSPAACHESGKPYRLLSGKLSAVPVLPPDDLRALLTFARLLDEAPPVEVYREPARFLAQETWSDNLARSGSGLRPGEDYALRGDPLPLLQAAGWEVIGQRSETVFLRRPGKGRGLSATWNNGGYRYLYVFSLNGAPFEAERGYSAFAVYALLEQGGDFAAAARILGAEGYGDQTPLPAATRTGLMPPRSSDRQEYGAPAPKPQEIPWPEPMGREAYHGLLGDVVTAIDPHTESDPHAVLVQLLAAFGNAVGRNAHYRIEGDRHHTNLFTAIVGTSGKGRKGTSWGNVRSLLAEVDAEWSDDRIKSGLSSGEGLIQAVRDEAGEGFGEVVDDKRLLVIESELATVLRVMERDGNTISARLRDA